MHVLRLLDGWTESPRQQNYIHTSKWEAVEALHHPPTLENHNLSSAPSDTNDPTYPKQMILNNTF